MKIIYLEALIFAIEIENKVLGYILDIFHFLFNEEKLYENKIYNFITEKIYMRANAINEYAFEISPKRALDKIFKKTDNLF